MFLLCALAVLVPPPPELALRAVAYLRADPDGVGTGFVLATVPPKLITCRHVLGDRKSAEVFFPRFDRDGTIHADKSETLADRERLKQSGHLVTGKVLAISDELDLAVLELPALPSGVNGLSLAKEPPAPGEPVFAVGCRGDQETLWNVSRGFVRQSGPLREGYFWQGKKLAVEAPGLALQLPVEEGDSGGPVLNSRGEVVAVVSAVRRRVPQAAVGPDARAIRAVLKLAPVPVPRSDPDRLMAATVWISPGASDHRCAGVIVDVKRKWVLTSHRAVGQLRQVGVAFPIFAEGKAIGDREAYRDPVSLHLSGHWAVGTVIARDASRDLAMIELDRLPALAGLLPFAKHEPRLGDAVRAVSHPVGLDFVFTHSAGSIRQRGRLALSRDGSKQPTTVLQLPAQSNSAGGPIVTERGELLGILAATPAPAGIGYMLSLAETEAFVSAMPGTLIWEHTRALVLECTSIARLQALATADTDMALSLDPDCLPARLRRAGSRLQTERFAEAVSDLDRITERFPQHEAALKLRARAELGRKEPKAAQSDLQRILEIHPADLEARLLSAEAYAVAGDEVKATGELVHVIRLDSKRLPDVLRVTVRHADRLQAKGFSGEADWMETSLRAVLKVLPGGPERERLSKGLSQAPTDNSDRVKYLRHLCGEKK